jgi:hypothetical protein
MGYKYNVTTTQQSYLDQTADAYISFGAGTTAVAITVTKEASDDDATVTIKQSDKSISLVFGTETTIDVVNGSNTITIKVTGNQETIFNVTIHVGYDSIVPSSTDLRKMTTEQMKALTLGTFNGLAKKALIKGLSAKTTDKMSDSQIKSVSSVAVGYKVVEMSLFKAEGFFKRSIPNGKAVPAAMFDQWAKINVKGAISTTGSPRTSAVFQWQKASGIESNVANIFAELSWGDALKYTDSLKSSWDSLKGALQDSVKHVKGAIGAGVNAFVAKDPDVKKGYKAVVENSFSVAISRSASAIKYFVTFKNEYERLKPTLTQEEKTKNEADIGSFEGAISSLGFQIDDLKKWSGDNLALDLTK